MQDELVSQVTSKIVSLVCAPLVAQNMRAELATENASKIAPLSRAKFATHVTSMKVMIIVVMTVIIFFFAVAELVRRRSSCKNLPSSARFSSSIEGLLRTSGSRG
jgi:hypothetical protein